MAKVKKTAQKEEAPQLDMAVVEEQQLPLVADAETVAIAAEPELVKYNPLMLEVGGKSVTIKEAYDEYPDQVFNLLPEDVDAFPEKNGRAPIKRDLKNLEALVRSDGKVTSPVKAFINEAGRPELVFGFGRHAVVANINAGLKGAAKWTLPVIIDQSLEDPKTAFITNAHENIGRDQLTPIDKYAVITRLKSQFGITKQADIADALGIHKSSVSYLTSIGEKITYRKGIEAIHNGVIPYSVAVEIAKADTPEKMIAMCDKAIADATGAGAGSGGKKSVTKAQREAAEERGRTVQVTMKEVKDTCEKYAGSPGIDPRVAQVFGAFEDFASGRFKAPTLLKKVEGAVKAKSGGAKAKAA